MADRITAAQILALLAVRHSEDVFVPECKDGPTQAGPGYLRMDAWVMPRSWTKPACSAYEIKVTRSDWLRDEKWRGYLELCNRFYFAVAPGVMLPEECPPEAGLLVCTTHGKRLLMKKKAPERDIEIPESLWRYVLMCRSRITRERYALDKVEEWRAWLAEKEEKRQLGYNVSAAIRATVENRVTTVEAENIRLAAENKALAECREILAAAGIDSLHSWRVARQLEQRLHAMAADAIPPAFARDLKTLEDTLAGVQAGLAELHALREAG